MKYMTHVTFCTALALGLAGVGAYSQTPQDAVKQAGRSTKETMNKVGSATSNAAKKTAQGTKKAGQKAAGEMEKGKYKPK
jgi:hypothetical protein